MIESSQIFKLAPQARLFSGLSPWRPSGSGMEEQINAISRLCADQISTASASDATMENPALPAAYAGLWGLIDDDLRAESEFPSAVDLNSIYGKLAPVLSDDDIFPDRFRSFPDQSERGVRRAEAPIASDDSPDDPVVHALHRAILNGHHELGGIGDSFEEAKRQLTWRYQWVVVHDFLHRVCGEQVVHRVLDEALQRKSLRARYPLGEFQAPAEFTKAAFRLGMTISRPTTGAESWLELLGDAGANSLHCFRFGPHTVECDLQEELDLRPEFSSQSFLMLLSSWDANLPSGQEVARELGIASQPGNDPLWLYILKEAKAQNDGVALGELGATLVARVIIEAIADDPDSFLNADSDWRPASRNAETAYGLREFLHDCGAALDAPLCE